MYPRKILILDGYTDEPAGLGVPPYIDVYPRYVAGAIYSVDKHIQVRYMTVDEFRKDLHTNLSRTNSEYDMVIVIAGVIVPGKYLGGDPLSPREAYEWFSIINKPLKILVGPATRYGFGGIGGYKTVSVTKLYNVFDYVVKGDPEIFIYNLLREGENYADPHAMRRDYALTDKFAILGASIVKQHPNYGFNLIAEIETYRGCSRWVVGGCSFCIEPLYGKPVQRSIDNVVKEVKALHDQGVRNIRLGRQPDFYTYGSKDLGREEFPKPNPEAIKKLFYGIRSEAPFLRTIHIDNVNPGTIAKHKEESIQITKIIIRYHTPGDVAALGIESADPKVIKTNNIGVDVEEAMEAIEILNKYGSKIGYNGLPELLPGINFVLGLPGETKNTYRHNLEFLETIYSKGLLVRRINIRQVLVVAGTRLSLMKPRISKHCSLAQQFTRIVRKRYDPLFLKKIVPPGRILREVFVEKCVNGICYARQAGTYPLTIELVCKNSAELEREVINVMVTRVKARSVIGVPIPLNKSKSSSKLLAETRKYAYHLVDRGGYVC